MGEPMQQLSESAKPILNALMGTAMSVMGFALLRATGIQGDASLISAVILAGLLNIRQLASLNCARLLPTSEPSVGELSS
jgi:hypothetical protein